MAWVKSLPLPVLATLLAGLALYTYTIRHYGHAFATVDGYLYYAHAHSWYFDGDLDLANDLRSSPGLGAARETYLSLLSTNNRVSNIMPVGWSILALPALPIADALTALHNLFAARPLPRDGYSFFYATVVPLPHLGLGCAGLWASFVLARRRTSPAAAAWATAAVSAGTGAMYYAFAEPTMSHAASMGLLALTCRLSDRIRRGGWSRRGALALGLCCGMTVAVRYYDVVWLLVPVLVVWPRILERNEETGHRPGLRWIMLVMPAAAVCLLPQVTLNLVTEGSLLGRVAQYGPRLTLPRFDLEMWAPQTGLLSVYPLTAFALTGLAISLRRRREDPVLAALAVGFAAYVAIYSFAYCPGYSRRYTCCAVLLVLGLSALLEHARSRPRLRAWVFPSVALLCAANLIRIILIQTGHLDRRIITQGHAELAPFVCEPA
ncbi:MAG: hypothetical protein IT449_02730 [Phycisphaerales bacterium]|nr:hypothetical protein [Phycisphaerales bacterium]